MLKLRIIFYVEINRLCLGALQICVKRMQKKKICDGGFAAIIENNGDGMNITHKYSTDEGCMVAINSSSQSHGTATIKKAMVSTSHGQGSVLLKNMA